MSGARKISFAISAALASCLLPSSASAASSFDVGASPAIITGAQVTQNKLVLGESGTSVVCTTATVKGTTTGTNVTEATLTPFYGTPSEKTCKLGGLAASVEVGTCQYTIKSSPLTRTAFADITSCGFEMIIKNTTCTVTIPNQGAGSIFNPDLESITFSNEGSGSTADVLATLNVRKIIYKGGSGCPSNVVGQRIDGKLTGTMTLKAFSDEALLEGSQVSLVAT